MRNSFETHENPQKIAARIEFSKIVSVFLIFVLLLNFLVIYMPYVSSAPCPCGCGKDFSQCESDCPYQQVPCDCGCGFPVTKCGYAGFCGNTPKKGCQSYIEKCNCPCGLPVTECKAGKQCGATPQVGCEKYVEKCNCPCGLPATECGGKQCDTTPKEGCPKYVEEELCECICGLKISECDAGQCGKYPMPACPKFLEECECGCRLEISECDAQQCGSTPQPACKLGNCRCGCGLTVSACGAQCYDTPSGSCPNVESLFKPYKQDRGWENKKGQQIFVIGADWEGFRIKKSVGKSPTVQVIKIKINPRFARIPWKTDYGDGHVDTGGGEVSFELSIWPPKFEAGAQLYGAKVEQQEPGDRAKVSTTILGAGGKIKVDLNTGKVGTEVSGPIGGGFEVNPGKLLGLQGDEE